MTKVGLELLLERVSIWPQEAQKELLRSIVDIEARHGVTYQLSEVDREAIGRGLADMKAKRFATDDAVAALFDRYLA